MTAREALKKGYTAVETRLQHGYISRKTTLETAPVIKAGGRRKGQLYFLWPNFESTRYCYRVYIAKSE